MEFDQVARHYREALEAINTYFGGDLRTAAAAANGAWWMAVCTMDANRPSNWIRSDERTAAVNQLDAIRDEFVDRVAAEINADEVIARR